MEAIITLKVKCPKGNVSEREFLEWVEFNIGKIKSTPITPLSNHTLRLFDAFANEEIIRNAKVSISQASE